jgi:hypothetical protein
VAAVAVLLSAFISEPFYTSPAVALGNSAGLLIIMITFNKEGLEASDRAIRAGRLALGFLAILILGMALLAIATRGRAPNLNRLAFQIATTLGSGFTLYGLMYMASVYATFANTPDRLAALLVAGLIFTARPLERLIQMIPGTGSPTNIDGPVVVDVRDPSIAVVQLPSEQPVALGASLQTDGGAAGLVVEASHSFPEQLVRVWFSPDVPLEVGANLTVADDDEEEGDPVVGFTASGTSINALRGAVSAAAEDAQIEEGRLIIASIRNRDVLFQVTDAAISESPIADGRHAGFVVDAQKLGVWDEAHSSFELVPWLPTPGTPVRLKQREDVQFEESGLGFVPGSAYAIRFEPTPAVTHNTAILGILGSGKTTLAREMICRAVMANIKVLVFDITGQYGPYFDSLTPAQTETDRTAQLNGRLDQYHEHATQDQDRAYGSIGEFNRAMRDELQAFLQSDERLRIYNPLAITATTIEGFARGGRAEGFRELSLIEKTSVMCRALLDVSASLGESEEPRVWLVLEEAHSLTPESTEGLIKDDIRAVSSSARSILQGRKYGFGCLLITQRTANVTKTILNQCHTMFALRSYDATGVAFLSNYFGDRYSNLLSSLPKYHCVAFGEGVSCSAPIVIRLNDPQEFRAQCWDPAVAEMGAQAPAAADSAPPEVEDDDDDIPY